MNEYVYDGSMEGLFAMLDRALRAVDPAAALPDRVHGPNRRGWGPRARRAAASQPDLFGDSPPDDPGPEPPLICAAFLAAASDAVMTGTVPAIPAAQQLHELSFGAYDCFVQGWMSELPIEAELVRFAWKVLDAGQRAAGGVSSPAARGEAETAAADREDPDVETTLAAAHKVWKELDRLRGLLRFSPGRGGVYLARCAPDHFVLPGLAGHFTTRFGETPWAIIDERRGLALARDIGAAARLIPLEEALHSIAALSRDPWEDLWRSYHRIIANETRANPKLQQQFMPRRYWKYLPETDNR
ncbi:MAG: TIGR03915 family putative DNA repair protein [Treponema sp.]|jgi:probable DNA metabolism protein|nr:TIGR03915 family putative DNA repair protein [Treponema sp.]